MSRRIELRKNLLLEDPEVRIREYCEIEEYRGYDDKHSINDIISNEDIWSANDLYAMIDRYDNTESSRLLHHAEKIKETLAKVPNKDIFAVSNDEWLEVKNNIKTLLTDFLSIRGIGLAKATKILHLKRPNLFPVLDSFIIKFLLDIEISEVEKTGHVEIGLKALELTREKMIEQEAAFRDLVNQISGLPIKLTPVRMFDILCWTTEKWDIRKNLNAPYGTPHRSLLR